MKDAPTIAELFKAKAVAIEQVNAAAEAYLNDTCTAAYELTPAITVDVSAAVEQHAPACKALAEPDVGQAVWRTVVRTAILLAGAVPGRMAVRRLVIASLP